MSAVVDIKTREGNKKRFGGTVAANPFQAKVLVEGPIIKLDEISIIELGQLFIIE